MLSDRIIKKDFIVKTLRRDMEHIYDAMTLIARANIYREGKDLRMKRREGATLRRRTGALLDTLAARDYGITTDDDRFLITARFIKHLRFLDMKRLGSRSMKTYGNWKIYNRQVRGILYNNALPDIRYGIGTEAVDEIGAALREAFSVYLAGGSAGKK
jgi:hypothetical protein